MPNLTIKPVAAAGNKVILQDQAGNTRLQTDDAGITITAPTTTRSEAFPDTACYRVPLCMAPAIAYTTIPRQQ